MNGEGLEVPQHHYRAMLAWIRQNHYLILIIAIFSAQTPPAQQWVRYITEFMSKAPVVHTNIVASTFLTRAVLDRRGPHLLFYLWLASMLLEYNYLTLHPYGWGRLRIWKVTVPWQVAVHLIFIVGVCSWSVSGTLVPGQRRVPTDGKQSSIWETRDLKEVRLVTFPPVNIRWPFVLLRKYQGYASDLLQRIVSSSEVLTRIRRQGRLDNFIATTIITALHFSCFVVNPILFLSGRSSTGGQILSLCITLYLGFLSRIAKSDVSRLWFFNELMYHQALEVDGRYYELTREGWFANSIKFSSVLVAEDSRKPLYSAPHGYTFFTHGEICDTGEELVLTSPGYELLTYNCISLRSNLFNRIKDDRNADYVARRRGVGYANPFVSLPATVAVAIYSTLITQNMTRKDSGAGVSYILFAAQFVAEILVVLYQIRAVGYWSSTAYGRVYRNRTTLPPAIGLVLFLRTLTIENGELPGLPPMIDAPTVHLNTHILMPVIFLFAVKFWLFYRLSYAQVFEELYFDKRFVTEMEWTRHGREYYPGEREEENRRIWGKEGLGQVKVQVQSVCGRPLDGECTRSVPFWPQSRREKWLLVIAAFVLFCW